MNRKNRERGNAGVEFALSFLVFFSAIYGIMEFGRVVASYNILAGATREGTRYAAVHGSSSGSAASSSDIQTFVRNWAIGLNTSSVAVSTTWSPGNSPGSTVQVQSTYTLTPFTGLILTNNLTIKSTSQMVISQ